MSRFNLVFALIAALALALADPARAYGDHDHDHDHASPAADSATDSPWACTAVCTADADTNHPCGADKYVAREPYKTCALTETAIMAVDDYKTAEHVVACPSAVCATKCTDSGAAAGFHCFNTSMLMDSTAEAANERALAMGCVGNHGMNSMFMAGEKHGDCLKGHNHNDYMATGAALSTINSVVVAVVVALAAVALA